MARIFGHFFTWVVNRDKVSANDPDPIAFNPNADPDPEVPNQCGSMRIRIQASQEIRFICKFWFICLLADFKENIFFSGLQKNLKQENSSLVMNSIL